MRTRSFLTSVVAAAALGAGAAIAADDTIKVIAEQGKTVAEFTVGDSRCVLKDDRLRCVPVGM